MIELERLKRLLTYCEHTGVFTWNMTKGPSRKLGSIAGSIDSSGHRQIKIDGKCYSAHRLAWFYFHGVWPTNQVDHKNNIRDDNQLTNLREATNAQNQQNGRLKKNGTGFKGVIKKGNKWGALITVCKKHVWLGSFRHIEQAAAAYDWASVKYFGEFSKTNGDVILL